ncbi:hypothetical protein RhiTH_007223 [Rhizoctonia solani]
MSREDLSPTELAKIQVYLAAQGYEIQPIAPPAPSKITPANQTTAKPATMAKPVAAAKPTATTRLTVRPGTAHSSVPYSPYRSPRSPYRPSRSPFRSTRSPLIAVPSPRHKSSKLIRPPIQMRYMKKPKGTVGRKGKYGWPAALKDIFGVTPAEYQCIFSIIKRLVFKKLDTTICFRDQEGDNITWVIQKTYKFIPEFRIYKGDWPIQGFMQSILKNANYKHRKLVKGLAANPDDLNQVATGDHEMTEATNAANRVVDADSSDDEDATKEADYNTSMVSAANVTFEMGDTAMAIASPEPKIAGSTSDSDEDTSEFFRKILPPRPALSTSSSVRPPDSTTSGEPNRAPVQRPRPRMRPPPQDRASEAPPTEQESGPLPGPVPASTPAPTPAPSPSPSPEPQPKPSKKHTKRVPAVSKTHATRAKAPSQPEPEPESELESVTATKPKTTSKPVKRVAGKSRGREIQQPELDPVSEPEPEPEPELVLKPSKRSKSGKPADAAAPAPKPKAAPKPKVVPNPQQVRQPKATSSRPNRGRVGVAETTLESDSELSDVSASRSNPPQASSDAGEELEYEEEEESHPVATVTKSKGKKVNKDATFDSDEDSLTKRRASQMEHRREV